MERSCAPCSVLLWMQYISPDIDMHTIIVFDTIWYVDYDFAATVSFSLTNIWYGHQIRSLATMEN